MDVHENQPAHLEAFIRLNERWIVEHFSLEEADRALARDPGRVIADGGLIFSLVVAGEVVGVCALFREEGGRYQLARMAVDPQFQGRGYGKVLIEHALNRAEALGARQIYLLSNTVLTAAIGLYRRFGFRSVSEGQHPVYARCNIVMERLL